MSSLLAGRLVTLEKASHGAFAMALMDRESIDEMSLDTFAPPTIAKEEVRSRIADIGIVPMIRTTSEDDAFFVAETLLESEIPILEISTTYPGFVNLIDRLCNRFPDMIVGAGSLFDTKIAGRCLDAGAKFLSSDGLIPDLAEFASRKGAVVFPGALTPSEIIAAWKAGVDFVKVTPCDAMGGGNYVHSLKALFPQVHLIASGGVNQQNASDFITAGATALHVSKDMMPAEAIHSRQSQRIRELARRFLAAIGAARG